MRRSRVLLQTLLLLVLIWGAVAGLRAVAGAKQVTAEKVTAVIDAAAMADWSERSGTDKTREEKLRNIAGLVNRLDFAERQKTRGYRSSERFYRVLSNDEKKLFIDLTVRESMGKFMEAIDSLPPEKRKEFVEQGLEEIESGKTAEEMARAKELGDDLLETIAGEGMRAYFEKANTDTKLDLAPLMESMNEVMQGLRGQEFGPPTK